MIQKIFLLKEIIKSYTLSLMKSQAQIMETHKEKSLEKILEKIFFDRIKVQNTFQKNSNDVNCPKHHVLYFAATEDNKFSCSKCKRIIKQDATNYQCRICKWHVCMDCFGLRRYIDKFQFLSNFLKLTKTQDIKNNLLELQEILGPFFTESFVVR